MYESVAKVAAAPALETEPSDWDGPNKVVVATTAPDASTGGVGVPGTLSLVIWRLLSGLAAQRWPRRSRVGKYMVENLDQLSHWRVVGVSTAYIAFIWTSLPLIRRGDEDAIFHTPARTESAGQV